MFAKPILGRLLASALLGTVIVAVSMGRAVWADDPLDSIALDPNAQIALQQTVSIAPGQTKCSAAYAKSQGMFEVDFAVSPDSSQLGMILLNSQQVQEVNTSEPITGSPLIRTTISGVASDTTMLPQAGQYWLCFRNSGGDDIQVEIRASFRAVN